MTRLHATRLHTARIQTFGLHTIRPQNTGLQYKYNNIYYI